MYKNPNEMVVHKKACDPKWSLLKRFFLCSLLCVIVLMFKQSFPVHSVSLFQKIGCSHPLLNGYCIYFRTTLAAINCVYTMYLTGISI